MNLIQLKLTSGEEIVAEVMEYPSAEMPEYIVRQAYAVRSILNEDSTMSYGLSPWMMMQERSTDYILIDPNSIISIAKPSEFMLREYSLAMTYALMNLKERIRRQQQHDSNMARALDEIEKQIKFPDSDAISNNVIHFPLMDDLDPTRH